MSNFECILKGLIFIAVIILLWQLFIKPVYTNRPQYDGMTDNNKYTVKSCGKKIGTPGYSPIIIPDKGNYSGDTVQKMSLESEIYKSQNDYINGLGFAGLPTGSSHETVLEETGRSYGTADYVGLTARKFCKARQMATPAEDARTVPTETVKEWCNIDMMELV